MNDMNDCGDTSSGARKYYGKYRGQVINNIDPQAMGRIQAVVPDVSGFVPSTWAMPCVPLAGKQMGGYFVPQFGANVWIEFEQGDTDRPIWVGCFWDIGEVPVLALAGPPPAPNIVLQTTAQNTFMLSDAPGVGIVLKTKDGALIMVNEAGITISNGKGAIITMTGNATNINAGGLIVT